jgi:hypothetical protein
MPALAITRGRAASQQFKADSRDEFADRYLLGHLVGTSL